MRGSRFFPLALLAVAVAAALWLAPEEPTSARGGERRPAPSATAGARDLASDERRGGHTLGRHVGLSDEALRERLADEPGISAASSFDSRVTAERVVAAVIEREKARIERWLARGSGNLALDYRGAPHEVVGRTMARGARTARDTGDARVVLARDAGGYRVVTAYPASPR